MTVAADTPLSLHAAIAASLASIDQNPYCGLDTVVLLRSIASQQPEGAFPVCEAGSRPRFARAKSVARHRAVDGCLSFHASRSVDLLCKNPPVQCGTGGRQCDVVSPPCRARKLRKRCARICLSGAPDTKHPDQAGGSSPPLAGGVGNQQLSEAARRSRRRRVIAMQRQAFAEQRQRPGPIILSERRKPRCARLPAMSNVDSTDQYGAKLSA